MPFPGRISAPAGRLSMQRQNCSSPAPRIRGVFRLLVLRSGGGRSVSNGSGFAVMPNDALMLDSFIRCVRTCALGLGIVLLTALNCAAQSSEPSPRIYSKEKPLFDRSVPEVTPGQGGETRAVVEPQKRDSADDTDKDASGGSAKADNSEAPAKPQSAAKKATPAAKPAPAKRLSRDGGSDVAPKSPYEPKTTRKSKTTPKQPNVAKKPKTTEKKSTAGASGVQIINPPAPAAVAATKSNSPAPSGDREITNQEPAIAELPTRKPPVPAGSRKAPPRKTARKKDHWQSGPARSDRYARRSDEYQPRQRPRRWARRRGGAPPGTYDSFVRCRPNGRCVRYYRVRRPRNETEYRRLRAWQYDGRPRRYRARRRRDLY